MPVRHPLAEFCTPPSGETSRRIWGDNASVERNLMEDWRYGQRDGMIVYLMAAGEERS
jgi:hypothetical protein